MGLICIFKISFFVVAFTRNAHLLHICIRPTNEGMDLLEIILEGINILKREH